MQFETMDICRYLSSRGDVIGMLTMSAARQGENNEIACLLDNLSCNSCGIFAVAYLPRKYAGKRGHAWPRYLCAPRI